MKSYSFYIGISFVVAFGGLAFQMICSLLKWKKTVKSLESTQQ